MATTTMLHTSQVPGGTVVAARWVCPADSVLWTGRNSVGDGYRIVLARRPVGIRHGGRSGLWADRGGAVLYDPWMDYDRRLLHPDGDVADILQLSPALVHEAVGRTFGRSGVLLSDAAYLAQRRAFAALEAGTAEQLHVEEALLAVLADVADQLTDRRPRPHARLVERTREELGRDLGESLSLSEVAGRVGVSPYHLARVFKAGTGSTLHGYREGLRLREAADSVLAGRRLTEVAADLGFSSHSHLTARFRLRFGTTPARLRASVTTCSPPSSRRTG